jgi:DNA-binding YbaB/EbfC family protein
MFGKLGDMLGKLQEIKSKLAEIKVKMDSTFTDVSGASGDIKITINGNRKIQKLHIAPALQHGSQEELERLLTETFNKAVEAADKLNEAEMKTVAGGMLPPGLL